MQAAWCSAAGKCKVDETEKGWYITLIHRDPMQVAKGQTLTVRWFM